MGISISKNVDLFESVFYPYQVCLSQTSFIPDQVKTPNQNPKSEPHMVLILRSSTRKRSKHNFIVLPNDTLQL